MPDKNHISNDLMNLKASLEKKLEKLTREAQTLTSQIRSVETTLSLLGAKKDISPEASGVFVPSLEGKTQIEALVALAQANNNRIRIKTARDILKKEGLLKSEKNGYTILSNTIAKHDEVFNRVGPGEYELKNKVVSLADTLALRFNSAQH